MISGLDPQTVRLSAHCTTTVHISCLFAEVISLARRLRVSRASRFICNFICEYFLKTCPAHYPRWQCWTLALMAGSDFSDWALVPGVDLHNELAFLVEAGFTPMEALKAATLNPAKFLGKTDTYGTIQVGRATDLVSLDMNPREDISHTRKIHAVVLGDKFYPLASMRAQSL
jgi:Amidohydrolase family